MDKSAKTYILRGLIVGFLLGQLFMLPHVIKWMKFPLVYVDIVPNRVYDSILIHNYEMNDVISKEVNKPTPVEVVISDPITIQNFCRDIFKNQVKDVDLLCSPVMGFHLYDKKNKKHLIYSIDSTAVLVHEFRHIFEGGFHRSPQ